MSMSYEAVARFDKVHEYSLYMVHVYSFHMTHIRTHTYMYTHTYTHAHIHIHIHTMHCSAVDMSAVDSILKCRSAFDIS